MPGKRIFDDGLLKNSVAKEYDQMNEMESREIREAIEAADDAIYQIANIRDELKQRLEGQN